MDRTTKLIVGVAAIAVLIALVVGAQYSSLKAEIEITRVTAELDLLRQERESVELIAQRNDSLQMEMSGLRGELRAEVSRREDVVESIEQARIDTVFAIRSLRQTDDIAARFARTFPEVTAAPWGVEDIYFADRDVELEMVMIHISALDQFLIEHENAVAFGLQVDTLRTVVELQDSVRILADSMLVLEQQTRVAYATAYDSVFGRYEDLNGLYIEQVGKPRFGINAPTLGSLIAAGAIGLLVGSREE